MTTGGLAITGGISVGICCPSMARASSLWVRVGSSGSSSRGCVPWSVAIWCSPPARNSSYGAGGSSGCTASYRSSSVVSDFCLLITDDSGCSGSLIFHQPSPDALSRGRERCVRVNQRPSLKKTICQLSSRMCSMDGVSLRVRRNSTATVLELSFDLT
jgi:hypothetical protein